MDDPKTTRGMAPERRQQFEADIAQVRVKTGGAAGEPRLIALGAALMAIGAAVALIAFIASGSQADSRDVLSSVIIAVFGLSLTVAGAAVFLRYSIGRFLRFWLLRLIYEQQGSSDR
ncbi:MAG: putative integral rane protein [Ilumatobacteraceae bacterium]|nr:putative integral rane protein [Ilumatobacteraceae bacterium]